MDPLSGVLSLVKIRSLWTEVLEWGQDWCLQFGRYDGIRIYAVLAGECWMSVEGIPNPVHGKSGDCLLLPSGRPFRVGSDLALPAIDAFTLSAGPRKGGVNPVDADTAVFSVVCGHFTLNGDHATLLTGVLPPILHIRKESDKSILRWTLDRLGQEFRDPQPGGFLVGQQLVTMLLVQALRVHLAEGSNGGVGWLFALADRRMRVAIAAMHEDPGHRWTLQSLGQRAGMSRTSFAVKFKETVGKAPLEYLTEWRMLLAGDRLAKSNESIAVIAQSLGYDSDSAFSTAFKRVMGCSPRQYSHGQNSALDSVTAIETDQDNFALAQVSSIGAERT